MVVAQLHAGGIQRFAIGKLSGDAKLGHMSIIVRNHSIVLVIIGDGKRDIMLGRICHCNGLGGVEQGQMQIILDLILQLGQDRIMCVVLLCAIYLGIMDRIRKGDLVPTGGDGDRGFPSQLFLAGFQVLCLRQALVKIGAAVGHSNITGSAAAIKISRICIGSTDCGVVRNFRLDFNRVERFSFRTMRQICREGVGVVIFLEIRSRDGLNVVAIVAALNFNFTYDLQFGRQKIFKGFAAEILSIGVVDLDCPSDDAAVGVIVAALGKTRLGVFDLLARGTVFAVELSLYLIDGFIGVIIINRNGGVIPQNVLLTGFQFGQSIVFELSAYGKFALIVRCDILFGAIRSNLYQFDRILPIGSVAGKRRIYGIKEIGKIYGITGAVCGFCNHFIGDIKRFRRRIVFDQLFTACILLHILGKRQVGDQILFFDGNRTGRTTKIDFLVFHGGIRGSRSLKLKVTVKGFAVGKCFVVSKRDGVTNNIVGANDNVFTSTVTPSDIAGV